MRDEAATRQAKRRGRPAFGLLVLATILFRGGREVLDRVALSHFGAIGGLLVTVLGIGVVLVWRTENRRRTRARGGVELTSDDVRDQLETSGHSPTFAEDGTLLGASVVLISQRPKVLELITEYDVYGSSGDRLGSVRQIGQSRSKQVARVLTPFDQYFTHRFTVVDDDGVELLHLLRPRKLFKSKLHVATAAGDPIGTIRQRNVFWKIHFDLVDADEQRVGEIRARNLRAWDHDIVDRRGHPVASMFKLWEGWGRTAFTRADRYVLHIAEPIEEPLRSLVFASALTIDLALKQDTRGLG